MVQRAALWCGTILLLAVLGSAGALAWHGTITGSQWLGLVGLIVGPAVGGFAVHQGVQAGIATSSAAGAAAGLGAPSTAATAAETSERLETPQQVHTALPPTAV